MVAKVLRERAHKSSIAPLRRICDGLFILTISLRFVRQQEFRIRGRECASSESWDSSHAISRGLKAPHIVQTGAGIFAFQVPGDGCGMISAVPQTGFAVRPARRFLDATRGRRPAKLTACGMTLFRAFSPSLLFGALFLALQARLVCFAPLALKRGAP